MTGAYRINYAVMGNLYPVLYARIVPRYLSESEELRRAGRGPIRRNRSKG